VNGELKPADEHADRRRVDAGPILLHESTGIQEDETAPELMLRLAEIGTDLISETLRT